MLVMADERDFAGALTGFVESIIENIVASKIW